MWPLLISVRLTITLVLWSLFGHALSTPRVQVVTLRPEVNFWEIPGSHPQRARLVIPEVLQDNGTLTLDLTKLEDEQWKDDFLQVTHFLVSRTEELGLFQVNLKHVLKDISNQPFGQVSRPSYLDLVINSTSLYVNDVNSTVLLVTRNGPYLEVYGMLNDQMEITPVWKRDKKKLTRPGATILGDFNRPFIYNQSQLHRVVDHQSPRFPDFDIAKLASKVKQLTQKRHNRLLNAVRESHPIVESEEFMAINPEVSLFFDSFLYDALGRNIDAVWRYAAVFFSRIQLIFKQVDSPEISLHLKSVFVATRPFRFQLTPPDLRRPLKTDPTKSYLNAMKALREFGVYLKLEEAIFGGSDLTVVLTGQDLCLDRNVTWHSACSYDTVRGQAFVGGACKNNLFETRKMSVAIVEDSGHFDGVQAAAHEMAHLLGAVHDGEWPLTGILGPGGRGCSSSKGNLMSDGQQKSYKQYELSVCTREQLQYYAQLPQAWCLYHRPTDLDQF